MPVCDALETTPLNRIPDKPQLKVLALDIPPQSRALIVAVTEFELQLGQKAAKAEGQMISFQTIKPSRLKELLVEWSILT